ncbi:MAG: TonB-dependent receptor [Proteobacteria bacterium]|nr:TonB-dependent receptor [Pseudomonadota bacterium]
MRKTTFALTQFILIGPTPAQSQADANLPVLETVVVRGEKVAHPAALDFSSTSLPTQVTVIDRSEIERTNVGPDAGDLLRRVPGIQAHNLGQGSIGTAIKMRGFLTASHGADVAVYVDGVPQNIPSSVINHGMNDLGWLAPEMIERIEVIKGPFSALYGDQNRAGAINIVTRSRAQSSMGIDVASYGATRATAVINGAQQSSDMLLVADLYRTDGYRDNSDETRGTLFIKGSQAIAGQNLSLRFVHHKADWSAPGFLNLNKLVSGAIRPTDRDTSTPALDGDAERSSLVFNLAPRYGDEGLSATLYAEDYQRRRSVGANTTDINMQEDDRRILGGRILNNLRIGDRANLALGAELRQDRGDGIVRRWSVSQATQDYLTNQNLDLLTYGLFVQGQYKPWRTLKLLGGLRWDGFDYSIRNRKLPAASTEYSGSVTTPRVGIVWTVFEGMELFANTGEGFRSPSQAELSPSGSFGPLGASGGVANTGLNAPKVRSRDAGINALLGDGWQLTGAVYHTTNEDEISQIAPGIFASVGNTTRDGWELEARWLGDDAFSWYGSFGKLIKARINSATPGTADRLSLPGNTIKTGVAYTRPAGAGRLLFNADVAYISATPYFEGTPLSLSHAKQYIRYDLRASLEHGVNRYTTYAVLQPLKYSSESIIGSAGGQLLDPRPQVIVGAAWQRRF